MPQKLHPVWRVALGLLLAAEPARAQSITGTVLDQTGSVLPGVRVELLHGDVARASAVTSSDGRFTLPEGDPADVIAARLEGFEPTRVALRDAGRIVMPLAHAADRADVTATGAIPIGTITQQLGTTLPSSVAQVLPTARPRVLESLPLLPSVVRGPDGLLRLDGARPHEAGLFIDGFDVTDPVTGTTAIDLPLEAVKSVAVLRDPMAATLGGVLGALATVETRAGADKFEGGVQSFIPHPRLSRAGFGRIDGFFPRAYVSGTLGGIHLFLSQEYDFEHVPVPNVTTRSGTPTIGEVSATSFSRFDMNLPRQTLTLEGALVPARLAFAGMSPLRPPSTTPTIHTQDVFATVVDRVVVSPRDLVTVRFGILVHGTQYGSSGTGMTRLTPVGWRDNWFSSLGQHARRQSIAVQWERSLAGRFGAHTFAVSTELQRRGMRGRLTQHPIRIENANHELVRLIEFRAGAALRAQDVSGGIVVRDTWAVGGRVQVDMGLRMDAHNARLQYVWSPRFGVRYALDQSAATVIKIGAGRFVGQLPLHALAFSNFSARVDTEVDPETGERVSSWLEPSVARRLSLPRAISLTLDLERRLARGLDAQIGFRRRHGSVLPTVNVDAAAGAAALESTGASSYRELQLALRKTWRQDGQIFVSYVRSAAYGETNDFGSLYNGMGTPQVEPNRRTVMAADSPNRWLVWGTVPLPLDIAVSPAAEWRTGFPYSTLDIRRHYAGRPNDSRFPSFFSLDMVAYKTVEIHNRKVNLGAQLFNLTRHFNPRDVTAVVDTPQFQRFTNSRGLVATGYMMVKWQ